MYRSCMHGCVRGALALILCVSVSACSTTTHVALPSPELSAMNVRIHDARSTLTLKDRRQLEVEGLQVGVEHTRARLRRERTLGLDGERASAWVEEEGEPRTVTIASREIAKVEVQTDRKKGATIGGLTGLLLGSGVGAGVGYAIADATVTECPDAVPGFPPPPQYCNDGLERLGVLLIGLAVGAVVFSLAGLIAGSEGVHRTYLFEGGQAEAAVGPTVEPVP